MYNLSKINTLNSRISRLK